MTDKPIALRLADILEKMPVGDCDYQIADELRRLHEANEVLLEALRPIAEIDLRTQGIHHKFPSLILGARAAIAKAAREQA